MNGEENPEMANLAKFLKWLYPLDHWANMIMFEFLKNTRVQWIVIIFYKPQYFMQNGPATQLAALPSSWIHKTYFDENPPTPYQQQLKQALEEYWTNIPDPKEWSQDYPMHCSQVIQETPVWKDIHEAGGSRQNLEDDEDVIPDDLERRIEQLEFKCRRARERKRQKIEELNITSDIDTDYDTDTDDTIGYPK
ncbi:hypothetical protein Goshw_019166 [Gossypium schwendimanii]|uniref:Uncharacterized protein n=1 Tax=Gossypium schwendimanii TaxID=34291 RepID=A0A7J9N6V5_GOSSC|nr:hypothetical protein [Gossypium schwendimanii]